MDVVSVWSTLAALFTELETATRALGAQGIALPMTPRPFPTLAALRNALESAIGPDSREADMVWTDFRTVIFAIGEDSWTLADYCWQYRRNPKIARVGDLARNVIDVNEWRMVIRAVEDTSYALSRRFYGDGFENPTLQACETLRSWAPSLSKAAWEAFNARCDYHAEHVSYWDLERARNRRNDAWFWFWDRLGGDIPMMPE